MIKPLPLKTDFGAAKDGALVSRAFQILTRTAVLPATSTGWASELGETGVVESFVASLPSAVANLIGAGIQIPLQHRQQLTLPRRDGTKPVANPAYWTTEGGSIPAYQDSMVNSTLGPTAKLAVIVVMSRELADHSGAQQIFGRMLRENIGATLDSTKLSNSAAAPPIPAGLLNEVTPLDPSAASATPTETMLLDLKNLAAAIVANGGNPDDIMYIAAGPQAVAMNLRRIPVWPTLALSDGSVAAVDKSAFVSAFGPEPIITTADETPIVLGDPASDFSSGPPSAIAPNIISCFQADCRAVKVELDFACCWRADGRIAVVNSVVW